MGRLGNKISNNKYGGNVMPELEKSIEKEVALTSIKAIMESNNIDITDIPGSERISQLQNSLSTAIFHARNIYEKLIDEIGEDKAYEWAEDNISSDWREEIGILKPRRYKSAVVTIEVNVIAPDTFETQELEELALNCDLANYANVSVYVEDENICRNDIICSDFANDPDDFSAYDWE